MDLKGLKVNFLGDSITEGHGTSSLNKRFTDLLASRDGIVARNYGIGGTRIAKQTAPSACARHDLHFIGRVEQMDSDCDVVLVFGGTNDYGHGDAPLGNMTDRTELTFYGALHVLYTTLINKYPEAKIVIMTPIHREIEVQPKWENGGLVTRSLKQYVDAIREVAEFYSLPVLDTYACYGIQPCVPIMKEKFVPDGLHPNDAGHVILADKIKAFLQAM